MPSDKTKIDANGFVHLLAKYSKSLITIIGVTVSESANLLNSIVKLNISGS